MRSRLLTVLGAAALALGGLSVSAGPAAADPAHCYGWGTHPDRYSAGGIHFGNGTAIRRGPYTDCDAFGLGYPSHGIDIHCFVFNSSNNIWLYLVDTTTGVAGWSRNDTLTYDGLRSLPAC
ncbi:MAG: hypothetical protein ABIQ09_10030 [Jatrophihabitantaceae bacterium]